MARKRSVLRSVSSPEVTFEAAEVQSGRVVKIVNAGDTTDEQLSRADALIRMTDAEDTLRAIGAGEVDGFVVSDGESVPRVFTLSTADRPYRMFVENMRDGAATLSPNGLILYANQRLADLLACKRETIVGSPLAKFMRNDLATPLATIRGPGELGATVELDLVDGNGVVVPVLVGSSLLDVDGDPLTCLTLTDLSAQKAQEREIARLGRAQSDRMEELQVAQAALIEQATHDALTGLPNRALLVDRIDQALARSQRTRSCTAVFFLDLDRFKHVNDTQGHAVGDTVLRSIADKLVAILRPMDSVARIGGDEFVVLAPDVENHLHAISIGDRVLSELGHGLDVGRGGHRVAASVGVSVSIGGRGTAEVLLDEADKAMYHAKSLGGGRVQVFDATLGRHAQARSHARQVLQSALDDDRIIVHYQPVIDLSTGIVAGFEALARIKGSDDMLVPPCDFIPIAEESGLVVPLGTRVLATACDEAHGWLQSSGRELTIAVNLSSRQFQPGDLPTIVRVMLDQSGLEPSSLHLELTETAIMDLHPDILQQLGQIHDLGVQIGLDDFGTGYASLTHLRHLPVSFVKIDQTFVEGLATDREDERIVAAVVDLAANLGLRSIAEGVETDVQLNRLRELGCDQAQGYLFARPLPPEDVSAILAHAAW